MTLTGSSNPLYATSAQARFWEGKRAFLGVRERLVAKKRHKRNHKVRLFVGESEKNGVIISYHFFQSFSRLSKRHQLLTKVGVFPSTAKFAFKTCRVSVGNLRGRTGHRNFPCVVDFSRVHSTCERGIRDAQRALFPKLTRSEACCHQISDVARHMVVRCQWIIRQWIVQGKVESRILRCS